MAIPSQYPNSPQLSTFIAVQPGSAAYMAGWLAAAAQAASITPSAAGVATYYAYSQLVQKNYLSEAVNGFPVDFNDGFDDCLEMAGLWEYYFDPKSGHNVVIGS